MLRITSTLNHLLICAIYTIMISMRLFATSKGSVLAYGLVIMTSVAIILTSIIGFITSQTKYALQVHAKEQAFQIAESGIHFYRWYLAHQVEGRTAQQVSVFWENGNPSLAVPSAPRPD